MSHRRTAFALLALTVAPLGACAVLASTEEYTAYRVFQYERDPDRRTALGSEFLEHHPNGRYAARVRVEVEARDEEFWELHRASFEGLRSYVDAYPAGVHAVEARARIAAFEAERERLRREAADREQAERDRVAGERREANERVRLFARNTISYWLHSLPALDGWGEPIAQLAQRNADFNTAFGGDPAPQCRAGRCRKIYRVDFSIPVPGRTALSRQLALSLDLVFHDRRVTQAALVLPRRGLDTWYEQEMQRAAEATNPELRQAAVAWSMAQLRGVLATALPTARETPNELVGPEPEMEAMAEDGAEDPAAAQAAAGAGPAIPPQPLGVQFSYVVGCGSLGGAPIAAPADSLPAGWAATQGEATTPRGCFRIDAYSAPDIEGVNTDEGLRISWIPASAIPRGRGPVPARPAARPAPRPAAH